MRKNIVIAVLGLLIVGFVSAGSAQAGRLIGSGSIRDNSVRSVDIRDSTIRERDLAESVIKRIDAYKASTPAPAGATGSTGPKGEKGDKGLPGDPASDVFGSGYNAFDNTMLIQNIGGSFSTRSTFAGNFTLEPGTYLLNTSAFFDRIDNAQASSPQMQVALRSHGTYPRDLGTILTGNFPSTGDREITGANSTVVEIEDTTVVDVRLFGYNNDGSSTGSGNYAANVQVSAVKIG